MSLKRRKKKKSSALSRVADVVVMMVRNPSPWYLVGLRDGERPVADLEHVKKSLFLSTLGGIFWKMLDS
jgi:hypothetical protein